MIKQVTSKASEDPWLSLPWTEAMWSYCFGGSYDEISSIRGILVSMDNNSGSSISEETDGSSVRAKRRAYPDVVSHRATKHQSKWKYIHNIPPNIIWKALLLVSCWATTERIFVIKDRMLTAAMSPASGLPSGPTDFYEYNLCRMIDKNADDLCSW